MANSNGWGDGSVNNNIAWGQGSNNTIGWGKSHIDSWSGATDIDGGNLPSNSVAPALSGTAQEGQTLTCSTGTWSGSPTYTYQWKRNGNNITNATNSTYTLVTADVGQSIKCTVTATNFIGSSNADSNTVTPTSSTDADAQAFITAAGITDPTQQSAINQLVVDLKGYSIWTKMKALYPFVGGTSTTHKWNLKDPRDLDAAFRLVFSGGWTHSSTGATPNGTNGYADTFIVPNTNLSLNSTHLSYYSRTNVVGAQVDIGVTQGGGAAYLLYSYNGSAYKGINRSESISGTTFTPTNGMLIGSRNSSTTEKYYHKGSLVNTITVNSDIRSTSKMFVGAYSNANVASGYSSKQVAFASIGDGLTDTEAANFYTAVQTFQTTLGRSIGTQTVSDADAQAFVTNAGIVDQVEATAINNLVIGLKADSLWSKMKAIYPFVGGTATTNKFNLKNPLDTDAAFRLVFSGGWTHSSTGATPNGTNAYADTFLNPSTSLTTASAHFSKYNRTNDLVGNKVDGIFDGNNNSYFQQNYVSANGIIGEIGSIATYTQTDSRGLFTMSRTATNVFKVFKNSTSVATNTTTITNIPDFKFLIGVRNDGATGGKAFYNSYQCAFASLGDGLTDIDATNLNTRVTTFQTALNRNV